MKGELEAMGEDVDENVQNISKMQGKVLNLTHGKVNIFDDQGQFRSTFDIMKDIASVYDQLSSTDQADLLETIAGKNRSNDVQSLIANWQSAAEATKVADNAAGTAREEQAKWADSLEAKLQGLSTSWEVFSNDFLSSKSLKTGIAGLTGLVDGIDGVTKAVGAVPTMTGLVTGIMGAKGNGLVNFTSLNDMATRFKDVKTAFTQTSGEGKSLKSFASGVSDVFSLFRNGISKSDVTALKNYNTEFERLTGKGRSVESARQLASMKTLSNGKATQSARNMVNASPTGMVDVESVPKGSAMKRFGMGAVNMAVNSLMGMGVSAAIDFGISKITDAITAAQRLRQESIDTGKEAAAGIDSVTSAYQAYQKANIAYREGTGSKEALTAATTNLTNALGLEETQVNNLVTENGSMNQAMRNSTKDVIDKQLEDVRKGYKSAKNQLRDDMVDTFGESNISWHANSENDKKYTKDLIQAAKKYKDVLKIVSDVDSMGNPIEKLQFKSMKTPEDAVKAYKALNGLYNDMSDLNGKGWTESNAANLFNKSLDEWQENAENVEKFAESINKSEFGEAFDKLTHGYNKLPKSYKEYKKLRNDIIADAKSDKSGYTGDMTDKELSKFVDDNLSEVSGLEDYANRLQEQQNRIKNTKGIENKTGLKLANLIGDKKDRKELRTDINDYIKKTNKLSDAQKDLASGEKSSKQVLRSLKKEFPDLINYSDDLAKGITKVQSGLRTDMIASLGDVAKGIKDKSKLSDFSDFTSALLGVQDTDDFKMSLAIDMDEQIDSFSKLQTAMGEANSATGLTTTSIENLQTRYKSLENFNPSDIFIKTALGVKTNQDAIEKYEKQLANTKIKEYSDDLEELQIKQQELNSAIKSYGADNAYRQTLIENKNNIDDQIDALKLQISQYEGLTSAYNQYISSKSTPDERAAYETIVADRMGVEQIKNNGFHDADVVDKYLDLMLNSDVRTENNVADWEKLSQTIEGTEHSLLSYLTTNEQGQATVSGPLMFAEDIENKIPGAIKTLDNGTKQLNLLGSNMSKIMNEFGTTEDFILSQTGALENAGWDIIYDDPTKTFGERMQTIKDDISSTQNEVKELGGEPIKIDLDNSNIKDMQEDMDYLMQQKSEIEGKGASKTATDKQNLGVIDKYQNALGAQYDRETKPEVLNMDTSTMSADTKELYTDVSNLANKMHEVDKAQFMHKTDAEIKEASKGMKDLTDKVMNYGDAELKALNYTGKALKASGASKKQRRQAIQEQTYGEYGATNLGVSSTRTKTKSTSSVVSKLSSKDKNIDKDLGGKVTKQVDVEVNGEEKVEKIDKSAKKKAKKKVDVDVDGDKEIEKIESNIEKLPKKKNIKAEVEADLSKLEKAKPKNLKGEVEYQADTSEPDSYTPAEKVAQAIYTLMSALVDMYQPSDKNAQAIYNLINAMVEGYQPSDKNANAIYELISAAVDAYQPNDTEAQATYDLDSSEPDGYTMLPKDGMATYGLNSTEPDIYQPQPKFGTVYYKVVEVGSVGGSKYGGTVTVNRGGGGNKGKGKGKGKGKINGTANITGTAFADGNINEKTDDKNILNRLNELEIKRKKRKHRNGVANATGNWGNKRSETALVGEVGRELLVI